VDGGSGSKEFSIITSSDGERESEGVVPDLLV